MTDETNEPTSIVTTDATPEPRPFVPGGDALREAIKARTPPIHPAGYSEPAHSHAVTAGGLVAPALQGYGVPVVHPATPPDPAVMAAHTAKLEREAAAARAATEAEATRRAGMSPEDRIADLERTVARLVQLVPGAPGR